MLTSEEKAGRNESLKCKETMSDFTHLYQPLNSLCSPSQKDQKGSETEKLSTDFNALSTDLITRFVCETSNTFHSWKNEERQPKKTKKAKILRRKQIVDVN